MGNSAIRMSQWRSNSFAIQEIDSALLQFRHYRSGMKFNFSLPALDRAWAEVAMRTDEQATEFFSELRRLHAENFLTDPKHWN